MGNLFINFVISILLKLALTVVKDLFCDVNCLKCKKCMVICLISAKWYIKVLNANLKANTLRLFMAALWSPAGKGVTSWLLFVMFNCVLSLSHVVS